MIALNSKADYCLAIDIGASSGRHIVGWLEGGEIQTKEVYRFPNGVTEWDGHLTWDMAALLGHVKAGINRALDEFGALVSLSIDTWGCDYVLLRGDEEVWPCYAYRDGRTKAVTGAVHERVPFNELYRRTGCQFQPFNTGVKTKEYTNATTTGLVNAKTGEFDLELGEKLGLPKKLFPKLSQPGTVIGAYQGTRVVLCATHDTASAVEGIPMEGEQLYISSGTWSLLGVKSPVPLTDEGSRAANYSNEGGVGYIRYQKNIMGMWIINRLRDELCPGKPFPNIVAEAETSAFDGVVDANAQCFLAPERMKDAFDAALSIKSETEGEYFRCAYHSLALSYRDAIRELEASTGRSYEKLYIVGGGAKNTFLNELTAQATGKEVVALPIEATALGNLKIQMGLRQ